MTEAQTTTRCAGLRGYLADLLIDRMDLGGRLMRHIEQCPRCQARARQYARVGLAMRLVKSQPHSMGLLLEANRRTIALFQRDVRELPKACALRTQLPARPLRSRLAAFSQALASAAACLVVLLVARTGILSSMDRLHADGKGAAEAYCRLVDQAADGDLR